MASVRIWRAIALVEDGTVTLEQGITLGCRITQWNSSKDLFVDYPCVTKTRPIAGADIRTWVYTTIIHYHLSLIPVCLGYQGTVYNQE
jgi:hypothetical protein